MATNQTNKKSNKSNTVVKNDEISIENMEKTTPTSSLTEAQVEALLKRIADLESQVTPKTETLVSDFDQEKMIKFVSLAKGTVLLKGTASRPYIIEGQYNSRTFTETEARLIVSLMGGYMTKGFVYIDDPEFVRQVGLTDAYRHMLKPEQLQTLFKQSPENIVALYTNASEGQQKIIIDMAMEKIANGEQVDANVLRDLSNISGKNLLDLEADEE